MFYRLVLCGTNPADWQDVINIANHQSCSSSEKVNIIVLTNKKMLRNFHFDSLNCFVLKNVEQPAKIEGLEIVANIGLHPWCYDTAPDDWLETLRKLLIANPEVFQISKSKLRINHKFDFECRLNSGCSICI